MGIILSLRRVSGWKTEDDDAQRPISLKLTRPLSTLFERSIGERLNSTLKRSLRKICSFSISLCRCLKGVFHRIKTIFHLSKPRKTAGPLLPIENPSPKPSDHPPLKQALLISNDSATISTPSFTSHVLDSYGTSSITESDTVIDSATTTPENAPGNNFSYAEHEEMGIYISTGEIREESYDQYRLEQNQEYPSEVKNVVDSVTLSIPNLSDHALDYSESSNTETDSTAIIQENVPKSNESDAKHEKPVICISMEKKHEETSEEKESEGEKVIETTIVVEKGRWIKHYSSLHRILLVGDGDFSFSHSLAVAFGCASKMIATSLDSKAFLKKNYLFAPFNIGQLKKRGCTVMHGIDATTMATHRRLGLMTFDRIIYNFPFAGFFKGLSRDSSLWRHRSLVSLFLKNAKEMIDEYGEIHISHKTNNYHNEWNLPSLASSHGLRLIEEVAFDLSDYPGYNTKRGFGGDENFDCYPSSTFKFGLKVVGH